jgi:hypothetical protein
MPIFSSRFHGEAILPALHDLEARNPTRLRDFAEAARTLLEDNKAASLAAIRRVIASAFGDPEALYYPTRHLTHLGETGQALALFERVVGGGFSCYPAMEGDPWLDPLRKEREFKKLLPKAEAQHGQALAAFEKSGGDKILELTIAG